MAGSLAHIVAEDGSFRMDSIENLGDASEALEECHRIIRMLARREPERLSIALRILRCPSIDPDTMKAYMERQE